MFTVSESADIFQQNNESSYFLALVTTNNVKKTANLRCLLHSIIRLYYTFMASGDHNDKSDHSRDNDETHGHLVTPDLQLMNNDLSYHDDLDDYFCLPFHQEQNNQPDSAPGDVKQSSTASSADAIVPSANSAEEIPFDMREWIVIDLSTGKERAPRQNEYLELLLQNPRYTSYVSWTDERNGLFEVRRPEDVVRLWEKVKSRQTTEDMNYDTFARGIRHYYQSGLMIRTNRPFTFHFNRAYQPPK